ncbi:isoleucine--tRNA ligase [Acaricomes phytoseiuli]|uniref:isoleucine--tRNA ligase n=1 Tax=Acaricomes phytoseiuli TaxID=291968 RepID=UPI003873BFDC
MSERMDDKRHYPLVSTGLDAAGSAGVPASVSFPVLEQGVLDYWAQDGTFQASIDQRPAQLPGQPEGSNEFVFYDGPPFANGLPHYGHLLTGYAKDLVARFQTQRGRKVERRFGWDTHGLPAELEAMKQLGMSEKSEIEAMGIAKFNDAVRESVMKYAHEWRDYVTRQARWVDFDNDYKTLNVDYMESVLWAFKQLHAKGLTYQGFRVLPYCWKDETPLSNHELRMDDDVYQMRQDLSVTVAFPIIDDGQPLAAELQGVNLLAWTTTPWTLPTNFSIAVGPKIEYVVVDNGQGAYLLAESLLPNYAKDLGFESAEAAQAAIQKRFRGEELGGLRYAPLWDYYADQEKWGTGTSWQVLVEDYVTTTDGTGLVHQASAYGEEDQRSSEAHGIPVIVSVDEGARFLPMFAEPPEGSDEAPLAEIAGLQVFEANKPIIKILRASGRLIREASYEHSYPHCWRCRNPLIYKAVSSWYVRVTEFKDRMLELNQEINWIPGNVKDGQFGKWLENARDWSISRNRYWGSPIPVWVSDDPAYPRVDVYGSLAELETDFGRLPRNHEGEVDLHRPFIDELTRPNPDDPRSAAEGQSTMRRVEDVLDVWFDSGSMPYGQVHYPFENREWFDTHSPADFITEYIGQTRGWFYMLHILSTALFDRPAFKNVISHGIVLGSDGQKMSKSLRNYPDVTEVFDRDGSDAMRWFLMASPILRGGNLIVMEQGIRDGVRQVLLPLWNVYSFFSLYANAANQGEGYRAQLRYRGYQDSLDRYLLSNTGLLVRQLGEALADYDISTACELLRDYLDMLTNWYVRRSRQRFFDEDPDAFDALYTGLEAVCRVAAPLLPLVTEEIWRGLTGGRSVHLTDWPAAVEGADEFEQDLPLVAAMETVRQICSVGSSLRKAAKLRVRLPLAALTIVIEDPDSLEPFADLIADELNVKSVNFAMRNGASAARYGIRSELIVDARVAGPRLGKEVQKAIRGAKTGDWEWTMRTDGDVVIENIVIAGGIRLIEGEYDARSVISSEEGKQFETVAMLPGFAGPRGGFVVLDTEVTPELEAEGTARDLVRTIQQARKDAGLQVSDRIVTTIQAPQDTLDAVSRNETLVRAETLSVQLVLVPTAAGAEEMTVNVTRSSAEEGAEG